MIENEGIARFLSYAIESTENYYHSADKMKHSRITVPVTKMRQIASDLWCLSLAQKVKYSDSMNLSIASHLIEPRWYDDFDNRYISKEYCKLVGYNTEAGELTVEIKSDLRTVFHLLHPQELSFVSDLKFLIANVKKWYTKFGHLIRQPPAPWLGEDVIFTRGYESDSQKKAIHTAMTSPISYVWGAPGTGKTQIVLADCIMSYIRQGKQVLVLAPTNNAIEQTLRAIIRALEEQEQNIEVLYRLGTPSEAFLREYGTICETGDRYTKIEDLKSSIKTLKIQQEKYDQKQRILDSYEAFHNSVISYEESNNNAKALLQKCETLKQHISEICEKKTPLQSTLSDILAKESQVKKKEASFIFKIKKHFSRQEELKLHSEKELLATRKSACQAEIASLENDLDATSHALVLAEDNLKNANDIIQSSYKNIRDLSFSFFGHFRSIQEATSDFATLVEQVQNIVVDQTLADKIKEKEDLLKQISESVAKKAEGKLVFAFTIDYFFAHYENLSEVGIKSALISHIFLDEAAYCPFIKSGILFSLKAPVTLLGDHMQLPPICEASDRVINDQNQKIFFWSMSAIHFANIFTKESSLDYLFHVFKNEITALPYILMTATLPYTFRFGNNLAQILDQFVYKNGFTGSHRFNTDITIIHAQKNSRETELRTNAAEASAIRKYILEHDLKHYAVMTPYRLQRKLLSEMLRGIADSDNILTIHASQGREWETVIISIVDTTQKFLSNSSVPQGLYTMNTAISRAKKNVVIVCNRDYWNRYADSQLVGALINSSTEIIDDIII